MTRTHWLDRYKRDALFLMLLAAFASRGYIRREEIHEIFARYSRELLRRGIDTQDVGFFQDLVTRTYDALDSCIFNAKNFQVLDECGDAVLRLHPHALEVHLATQQEFTPDQTINASEAARITYRAFREGNLNSDLRTAPSTEPPAN
jgi:hypothetical protein